MASVSAAIPRVTIQFCTQCKWMLRAAYFAQELLSTFGTALGEVALQPSAGGTFIVSLYTFHSPTKDQMQLQHHVLWDRKAEGGFPEAKELKRRLRDVIEPERDLGHVDGKKGIVGVTSTASDHKRQGPNKGEESIELEVQKQDIKREEEVRGPGAISNNQVHDQELGRKFMPIGLDGVGARIEERDGGFLQNLDGGICEDCN